MSMIEEDTEPRRPIPQSRERVTGSQPPILPNELTPTVIYTIVPASRHPLDCLGIAAKDYSLRYHVYPSHLRLRSEYYKMVVPSLVPYPPKRYGHAEGHLHYWADGNTPILVTPYDGLRDTDEGIDIECVGAPRPSQMIIHA